MNDMPTAASLYKCTPRQARTFIVDCLSAGLVPFIQSSPGAGKSSIMKSVADEFGLALIDERLSTRNPVDLAGMPDLFDAPSRRMASYTPFDVYPTESTPIPKGKNGWILFLDEVNSAPKSVQAAAYKLVLDRMTGLHRLHPNVAIACAGNLSTDRAIVTPLSTAMQSRLVHIEMVTDLQEWLEDVAYPQKYDHRITAYLNMKPGNLMDFRPDHHEKTFCCPRTWEFMNRLIKGKPVSHEKMPLYAGTITSGVALDFVTFTEVFGKIPTIREILADPKNARVPDDPPSRWAVSAMLVEHVTKDTIKDLVTYANRLPTNVKILFYRSTLAQQPLLRTNPDFLNGFAEVSRYFHGV